MNKTAELDYLIVGAGPAGLQLGYFLKKNGINYLILEAGQKAGNFYEKFPRHRKLISINKVYTGYKEREAQLRYDWHSLLCDDDQMSFTNYSRRYFPDAGDYVKYLQDYAERFELNIKYEAKVAKISKTDRFTVVDEEGNSYVCGCLVMATGVSQPYIPEITGIELTENYYDFDINPDNFIDQRVLILGKSNSALETANSLVETARAIHLCSPESIKMAWNTHYVGHIRGVNNEFIDTYQLKGQNAILDAKVHKIEWKDGEYCVHIEFSHAQGQKAILAYDQVLVCTGFRFDASIFDQTCKPELTINNRFPALTSEWESINVKDLYFAGTIMQCRDFKKTMSGFVHGFRHNIQALSQILAQKYHAVPLPYDSIPVNPKSIVKAVIERVSLSAALFLQPGFLCDLLVILKSGATGYYYEDLPVDYVHDTDLGQHNHYYIITMEYGHFEGDSLKVDREPDPDKAYNDAYLHPVIRRFNGSTLVQEYHLPEHLDNDWRPDGYPGDRPLIQSLEYIGESDPTQAQKLYAQRLQAFFEQEIDKATGTGNSLELVVT
ncbi:NAD(P)-binding domain-containing protein [Moorena sp. SIO4G3]|uniref:NAD(P)-binding domain-containing protein n=1 Tax=Moorena sp. SIO4G3 TaxID=2607821 RepID=UPI00142B2D79|nr:NAD(P)-binding domain-containing protein [Moorena sp. SIO4G3]NEO77106.1 NAD(P)-binding domain-containing protein [Moorena sp. SIO4G3]